MPPAVSSLVPVMRRGTLTALLTFVLALAASAPALAAGKPWYQDGPGGRILLDGRWLFRADALDQGLIGNWAAATDTDGWTPVSVPHVWNAGDDSEASMAGMVGWYRRDFRVPRNPRGADWIVRFESVNYRATVFLNGVEIAQHEAASIPFEVQLEDLQSGVNRLVIRVDSRRDRTSLPPGPTGGWFNYGGINREVYLRPVTQLDMPELLARSVGRDELLIRATLRNPGRGLRRGRVTATVAGRTVDLGSARVPSGGTRTVSRHVRIPGARAWEPGRPALYQVRAVATVKGRAVARHTVHTGLRTLRVRSDGRMTLNGFPLNLRGSSLHEQTPARGSALRPADHARQIRLLREIGARITRSHYPFSSSFLEMADRAGIAVWGEIPFYQVSESAMRDPAIRQKGLDYLEAMIRRDQNHPSIVAWSIGNELPAGPRQGQKAWIRDAVALVRRLDPTRPVAYAFAGYPVKNHIRAFDRLDILGINDYFGWYPGPQGQIVNRGALGQYLDRVRANYPRTALYITEFGAEANRSGPRDEKGTYEFQREFMRFHLATYAKRPWLNGAINWVLQDFKVRPNWNGGNPAPDSPWLRKGVVDENGRRKPAWSTTRRAFRRATPLVRSR